MKSEIEKRISNKDVLIDINDLKKIIVDKVANFFPLSDFEKAKIYVQDRSKLPSGKSLIRGPKGGMYYDTAMGSIRAESQIFPKTKEERQAEIDVGEEQALMENFLKGVGRKEPKEKFEGTFKENKGAVKVASYVHLDSYNEFIDGKTYSMIRNTLSDNFESLSETEVSADSVYDLTNDAIDKLIYQEMRSWERQLGDHGVRHIVGNINFYNEIMTSMEKGKISNRDKLMGFIVMVNHDIGYTAKPARDTIGGTKYHKEYSEKMFENYSHLYDSTLSKEDLVKAQKYVLNHDTPNLDWEKEPVLSAISVADNLALFHKEKLPALFKKVPGALHQLLELQVAKKDKNKEAFTKAKKVLTDNVEKTNLPEYTKYLLGKAAEEVSAFTPKVTLSMLVGEVKEVKFDKDAVLNVEIKYNKYEKELNKFFDQGQKKFVKLAESFGIKDFDKNHFDFVKDGKKILSVSVKEGNNA